jgi:FAD/FMN-containing dehydrogenase
MRPPASENLQSLTLSQCARLSLQFPTKVFPGKTGAFKFWDAKQSDIAPTCRVEPESANDVSAMLKILVQERCHFAVKSGGNAREAGSSNASGGVTIDLVRLNKVSIANDRKSVKIGAGLKWLDVYSKLDPEGLTVFGGRISTVGVGGFLLSGEYRLRNSWHSI